MSLVEVTSVPADVKTRDHYWPRVKARLRSNVGEDAYTNWFARMNLEHIQGENVHLSVPTRFLKSWIQAHYLEQVLSCWRIELPQVCKIDLTVRSCIRIGSEAERVPVPVPEQQSMPKILSSKMPEMRIVATAPVAASHDASGGSPLDPRLSFATFVVGRSNVVAHAAARRVAESRQGDLVAFNPLYIHGGVGFGKTHLLQAIAWAGNLSDERTVLYLTAERFMHDFTAAQKSQTALAFGEALRRVDVLVIDDLQFLQAKSSVAEFCRTLRAFVDGGRQLVIGADRPPDDLENLDDRVRSRLLGGLVVELDRFNKELRLGILKARAAQAKLHHPDFEIPDDVLEYLAGTISRGGRELEGAINRLSAYYTYHRIPVTLAMAEGVVRDLTVPGESKRIRIEDIQRAVCRQYNVGRGDLLSSRRTANVVRPRQVAMYLAKTLTLRSLPEIGRRFGGRDHTTVLHAVNKIGALVQKDADLKAVTESLKKRLMEE